MYNSCTVTAACTHKQVGRYGCVCVCERVERRRISIAQHFRLQFIRMSWIADVVRRYLCILHSASPTSRWFGNYQSVLLFEPNYLSKSDTFKPAGNRLSCYRMTHVIVHCHPVYIIYDIINRTSHWNTFGAILVNFSFNIADCVCLALVHGLVIIIIFIRNSCQERKFRSSQTVCIQLTSRHFANI